MSHWPEGLVRNCPQVHAGQNILASLDLLGAVLLRRSN